MEPTRLADAAASRRRMFIRDLALEAHIGVHAHEHGRTQRVRINLDLAVEDAAGAVGRDDLARVVDYERIVNAVRDAVTSEHVRLVETLAERLAQLCLADPRVAIARVTIEKLDVFPDAASAGVEIERRR